MKLGIPIGVEATSEGIRRIQKDVPEQAIQIMNEYLYDTLNKFVDALDDEYLSAIRQFSGNWRRCIQDCLSAINAAKFLTEPASMAKVESLLKGLADAYSQIASLVVED